MLASTLGHLCLTGGVTCAIIHRVHMIGNEVATVRRRILVKAVCMQCAITGSLEFPDQRACEL